MGIKDQLRTIISNINRWQIYVLILLSSLMFINGTPFYFGDAYGYYHTGKTLVNEGSFITSSQPPYYPYSAHGVYLREDGEYASAYPPGVSIMLYPFLKVASLFDKGTIYTDYYKAFNGHSLADGLASITASLFYTWLSILMLVRILEGKRIRRNISLILIAGAYISTYGLSYITEQPGYSHTYEVFAITLVLFIFERFRISKSKRDAICIGIASSLLISIRPMDLLLLLPLGLIIIRNWKAIAYMILGALPVISLFLCYNYISYGGILNNGYQVFWGQTFEFGKFYLTDILFSDFRGLLVWSPAVILGLIGLLRKNDTWNILVYIIPPLLLLLLYSFWPYWYAGSSIGNRFFIVLIPYIAIGLSYVYRMKNRYLNTLIAILIVYSLVITILYRITPTTRLIDVNSDKAEYYLNEGIDNKELASPADIFIYHKELITRSNDLNEYITGLRSGFNGGRSLLLLSQGQTDPLIIAKSNDDDSFSLYIVPDPDKDNGKSDIDTYIEGSSYYLNIQDVDLDKNYSIDISCENKICKTNDGSLMGYLSDKDVFFPVTDKISIAIGSERNIKFINEKIGVL